MRLSINDSFSVCCLIFLRFYLFIWDKERISSREGQKERGIERERSRLPAEQEALCGAWSQDPETMTWAKGQCLTNWATKAPLLSYFFNSGLCIMHFLGSRVCCQLPDSSSLGWAVSKDSFSVGWSRLSSSRMAHFWSMSPTPPNRLGGNVIFIGFWVSNQQLLLKLNASMFNFNEKRTWKKYLN